jgi:hypothetical protein
VPHVHMIKLTGTQEISTRPTGTTLFDGDILRRV